MDKQSGHRLLAFFKLAGGKCQWCEEEKQDEEKQEVVNEVKDKWKDKPVGCEETAETLAAEDKNLPPFSDSGLPSLSTSPPAATRPCNRWNCCGRVWFLPEEVQCENI